MAELGSPPRGCGSGNGQNFPLENANGMGTPPRVEGEPDSNSESATPSTEPRSNRHARTNCFAQKSPKPAVAAKQAVLYFLSHLNADDGFRVTQEAACRKFEVHYGTFLYHLKKVRASPSFSEIHGASRILREEEEDERRRQEEVRSKFAPKALADPGDGDSGDGSSSDSEDEEERGPGAVSRKVQRAMECRALSKRLKTAWKTGPITSDEHYEMAMEIEEKKADALREKLARAAEREAKQLEALAERKRLVSELKDIVKGDQGQWRLSKGGGGSILKKHLQAALMCANEAFPATKYTEWVPAVQRAMRWNADTNVFDE